MENQENRIIIDYFSFVSKCDDERTILRLLDLTALPFEESAGMHFYKKSLRYCVDGSTCIIILYGGHEYRNYSDGKMICDDDVCVMMSGKGCRVFETNSKYSFMDLFAYIYDNPDDYNITRLDIAYDDFKGLLDINTLAFDTFQQSYITKSRTWKVETGSAGTSIYFGSDKSPILLRIYDKKAEQKITDEDLHWVRVELQLRDDRASNAVKYINSGICIDEVYFNALNNFIRFVEKSETDSNKYRHKLKEYWKNFLEYYGKLSLYTEPGDDYCNEKLKMYIEKQCSPSIVTFCAIYGLKPFLKFLYDRSRFDLNVKYKNLLIKNDKDLESMRTFIEMLLGDELHKIEGIKFD